MTAITQVFIYLQILDFLTTMIGFRLGAQEASPFIAHLIHSTSPAVGVASSKLIGVAIGVFCLTTGRERMLGLANYWFAGLVLWNLRTLLVASAGLHPHIP